MKFFTCPVCGQLLEKRDRALVCPGGHSHDIAAEGYVHLVPPNRMHSKMPGDTRQMVAARRAFLNEGHYALFSDALNDLALETLLGGTASPVILDAGCGEGYYTARLLSALKEHGMKPNLFGFDISKAAVRAAAKRYGEIGFAVASMFAVPARDAGADFMINVFAPIVPREQARVVRPGGWLLLAVPGARHLYGLKEILYDEPYENEYRETDYPGFRAVKRAPVRGVLRLTERESIQNLFAMTPYYWKTPPDGCERLSRTEFLETEIGFDFLLYQRIQETQ